MVNKLATIRGQSGCWYSRLLTNVFSSLTNTNHTMPLTGQERTKLHGEWRWDAIHPLSSTALSCPLTRLSLNLQTSKRQWDRQLEEQKGDVRAKAWYLTVKSSSVHLLSAQVDRRRSPQSWAPRSATQHSRTPGCPQQDEVVRWAIQVEQGWLTIRVIIFFKFIFHSKWITTSCPFFFPPVKT